MERTYGSSRKYLLTFSTLGGRGQKQKAGGTVGTDLFRKKLLNPGDGGVPLAHYS